MSGAPRASIVVPVFNRLELTEVCMRRLRERAPRVSHEVIVVDNGSTDGTAEFLAARDDVVVVSPGENLGFAAGCNAGAAVARGEFVCLLNNDVEVAEGFLDRHVEVLDADPTVVAVGSRLHYPDGRIQHAGVVLCDDRRTGDPFVAVHRFHGQPQDLPDARQAMVYRAVTAALVTIRHDRWDDVGGLDEGYWNGYEDVDLCLRLGERGGRIVYHPDSVAVHHESASGAERWRAVAANVQRLHQRFLGRVPVDVVIAEDGTPSPTPEAGFAAYELPAHP